MDWGNLIDEIDKKPRKHFMCFILFVLPEVSQDLHDCVTTLDQRQEKCRWFRQPGRHDMKSCDESEKTPFFLFLLEKAPAATDIGDCYVDGFKRSKLPEKKFSFHFDCFPDSPNLPSE